MDERLLATADLHRWDLQGRSITQLTLDPASVRFITWSLSGEAEIRIGTSFRICRVDGSVCSLDPEATESLAPILPLMNRSLSALEVRRTGEMSLEFIDGTTIQVAPDPNYEAWEASGGGDLAGIGYLCSPGGGSTWCQR